MRRHLRILPMLPVLAVLLLPATAAAQFGPRGTFTIELRGGFTTPTEDFGSGRPELSPEPGVTLGGDLMFNLTEQIAAYGGYSWTMFDCAGALCAGDADFTSSGLHGGFKFLLPLRGTVHPWVRAGALYHRLRFSNEAFTATSNRPIGFDSAAGVDIALGQRASFVPALRYHRYTVNIDLGPIGEFAQTVSFLNLDLAFHVHP